MKINYNKYLKTTSLNYYIGCTVLDSARTTRQIIKSPAVRRRNASMADFGDVAMLGYSGRTNAAICSLVDWPPQRCGLATTEMWIGYHRDVDPTMNRRAKRLYIYRFRLFYDLSTDSTIGLFKASNYVAQYVLTNNLPDLNRSGLAEMDNKPSGKHSIPMRTSYRCH